MWGVKKKINTTMIREGVGAAFSTTPTGRGLVACGETITPGGPLSAVSSGGNPRRAEEVLAGGRSLDNRQIGFKLRGIESTWRPSRGLQPIGAENTVRFVRVRVQETPSHEEFLSPGDHDQASGIVTDDRHAMSAPRAWRAVAEGSFQRNLPNVLSLRADRQLNAQEHVSK